jgi:hypothetical protein
MPNLCDKCKWANWHERNDYENAECQSQYRTNVVDRANYVVECSAYEHISFLKRIWLNYKQIYG